MSPSRLLFFAALGAAFWYQAAMIIRFFGTSVFSENNPKLLLFFVLVIPLTLLSLYLTSLLGKIPFRELLQPVVVMTFTATFLDGIALAWYRHLYSHSFEVALHGAAWILWGAGLGLLFSYYLNVKSSKPKME